MTFDPEEYSQQELHLLGVTSLEASTPPVTAEATSIIDGVYPDVPGDDLDIPEPEDDFSLASYTPPTTRVALYTPPPKPHEVQVDPIDVVIQRQAIEYRTGYDGTAEELFADASFTKPKTLLLTGNGLWAYVNQPFAKLLHVYSNISFQAHHTKLAPKWQLLIPKMPGSMYAQILSLFRHFTVRQKMDRTTEAMTQIYWDNNKREYFINIPDQEVTGAHVTFRFDNNDPRCFQEGVYKVFDIHSHNTMGAFFSGTDDRDETAWDQFFGVIGTISANSHTAKFRFGINGSFQEIDRDELIDMSTFTEDAEFPEEWLERIKFPTPVSFQTSTSPTTWGGSTPSAAWDSRQTGYGGNHWATDPGYHDRRDFENSWYNQSRESEKYRGQTSSYYYPKGRAPYGGSRGEWFNYFLINIFDVISNPKQGARLLNGLANCNLAPGLIAHQMRTVLGQLESKIRKSLR